MPRRHPLPTLWLLTDERQGDALWRALARLPRGSGVILRHYATPADARERLVHRVRCIARRRGHFLFRPAGEAGTREGVYGRALSPVARHGRPLAATAHSMRELDKAARMGACLVLLSPLFATRSHPGARPLGTARFAALARRSRVPVIALGGVLQRHQWLVRRLGAMGWAGIDGFTRR